MQNQQRPRIIYSDRYADDEFEYRHVILPEHIANILPKSHLLTETEWRNIGVQQSPGWIHYMYHLPEPHILLFRRSKSHPIPSDFGRHPFNDPNYDINNFNNDEQMNRAVDFN